MNKPSSLRYASSAEELKCAIYEDMPISEISIEHLVSAIAWLCEHVDRLENRLSILEKNEGKHG